MKSYFLIFLLSIFPIFADTLWYSSLEKALELAKSKNAPIVVDMYTDWCTYCKVLENKIFPAPEVAKEMEKFIAVRINGDESMDVVKHYRVSGYPTILFLDKGGNYIDRITGLPDSAMMTKKLKEAYEKKDFEEKLFADLKSDPDSVIFNYKIGIFYLKQGNFNDSKLYFQKSANSKKNENPEKKQEALFIVGFLQIQEESYQDAILTWSRYLTDYPNGDEMGARYYRGVAYFSLGKKAEAKLDFQKALQLTTEKENQEKIRSYLNQL